VLVCSERRVLLAGCRWLIRSESFSAPLSLIRYSQISVSLFELAFFVVTRFTTAGRSRRAPPRRDRRKASSLPIGARRQRGHRQWGKEQRRTTVRNQRRVPADLWGSMGSRSSSTDGSMRYLSPISRFASRVVSLSTAVPSLPLRLSLRRRALRLSLLHLFPPLPSAYLPPLSVGSEPLPLSSFILLHSQE
jgi:hypothetical protein